LQYNSTTQQTTAIKMAIKLNQQLSKQLQEKIIMKEGFIAGDFISLSFLMNWQLSVCSSTAHDMLTWSGAVLFSTTAPLSRS